MSSLQSKKSWLEKFRRVTSSTDYLPEVDGLRFMALFMVVIWMHTTHFIDEKFFSNQLIRGVYWRNFVMEGLNGLALFFIISGFVLSLPFAKMHFNKELNGRKVNLKQYYLRRLIRLEPPYILALIIFFIGNVWVLHKYNFHELLPHFFTSVIYVHDAVYKSHSFVLPVAWSLEVEVQFYLLAPLLCTIYFIRSKHLRWVIFLIVIIVSAVYNTRVMTGGILKFLCYFVSGMMLTDLYLNREKFLKSSTLCFWMGILLFLIIVFVPSVYLYFSQLFIGYWIKTFSLVVFFYIVLTNETIKSFFSNHYLTLIGGMCYSVYLLHFGILSALGKILQSTGVKLSNVGYVPVYFILFAASILLISSVYFLLIEKPFMKLKIRK